MINKSILASKTIWVQVAAVAAVLIPAVQTWLTANPVEFVAVLGAVNVIVRFVTSGKVTIFGGEQIPGIWFAIGCGTALTLGTALTSCSSGGIPLKVTAILEEGALSYSSKGGLEMEYRPGYGEMPKVYGTK